jgi:serine/threonine-protein kinase RsbW
MINYSIKTTCKKENLKQIRVFVGEKLQELGVKEPESDLMILAVDEVCANLIIHSNKNNNQPLEVNIIPQKEGVAFEIKDQGKYFDYSLYEPPQIEDIRREQRKGGLGMLLVRKIMDHIHYETHSDFNSCHLFKKVAF